MHTRALRSLIKIAHVTSFSEAAQQLGMTLSALSMQMKALEETLAVALFDRSVRPPRLTPMGRAVVAQAIPLIESEDRLIEMCRPSTDLAGQFRLGFVTTAAVRLLPRFLAAAQRAEPRAIFDIETGLSAILQDKVLSGQLDGAVLTDADGLPDRLAARLLRQEPFVFAAQSALLSDGLSGLLAHHAFFHFMPDTGIGKLIAQSMQQHERPDGAKTIVLDNLEAIMECVSAGLGFTLLPVPDVTRYAGPEIETLTAPGSLERKLVLVTPKDGSLARRAERLAALLLA